MRTVRWALSDGLFWLLVLIVSLIPLTGCTPWSPQNEIERADDLGLITNQPPPPPLLISSIPDDYNEAERNRFVEGWMARSDYLCRQYKDKINASQGIRDLPRMPLLQSYQDLLRFLPRLVQFIR
jgi:hypothetical protein